MMFTVIRVLNESESESESVAEPQTATAVFAGRGTAI